LNFEKIVDGGTFNNLTPIIVHFLTDLSGLLVVDVANKVYMFWNRRCNSFSGLEGRCYYLTHEQAQPFHCWHSLYGTSMQLGNANFFILASSYKN
jgi:hypothetical protein